MCNTKINSLFLLFLFQEIYYGCTMPQGFLFQQLSTQLVSWDKNEKPLTILPKVKVESLVKGSFINVILKKPNTVKNIDTKEPIHEDKIEQRIKELSSDLNLFDNSTGIIKQGGKIGQSNKDTQNVKHSSFAKEDELLVSKLKAIDENAIDDKLSNAEVTTESFTETTTDYETTTSDDELLNRASPQLVASLLG